MVRIAVVGCGGIGQAHLRAYTALPGVEIVACVDQDLEKAAAAAKAFGGLAVDSVKQIPAETNGVSVVTPPHLHFGLVRDLLRRRFHVFCEKPLTMDVGECQVLEAAAREVGCTLLVGFKMRFEPVFAKAREFIPEIGPLHSVSSVKQQPYTPHPGLNWIPAVGAMYELSVHEFDLIHWLTATRPVEVLHARLEHRFNWSREDAFALTVRYANGMIGQLQGMYATDSTFKYRDLTLTFMGEKGYIRIERPDRIVIHTDDVRVETADPGTVNAFEAELAHFCQVIRGDASTTMGASAGVLATALIEAGNAADDGQRPVRIGCDGSLGVAD